VPTVTTLACPVCGAPLQHGSSRCSYCGSMVTIALDHPLITPESINQALVGERISVHRAAVRKDSHDEVAHYGLGVAYFNLGLLEESSDELAEAARLVPENPNIQFQLAVVLFDLAKQGQPGAEAKAIDRLRRTVLLQPSHSDAHLLMANIQRSNKRWSDMLVSWEKAATDANDQVLVQLRGYVSERRQVLEKLERQLGQIREQISAAMAIPRTVKGPSVIKRTLGIFSILFVASLFLVSVQDTLGALVLLGSFASLIVVPLVMRSQRLRAARQAVIVQPVMVAPPPIPTVSSLIFEARDLNQKIELAERTLQPHQSVSPFTSATSSRSLQRDRQDWEYAEIAADKEPIAGLVFNVEVTGPGGMRREHRIGNFIADNRYPPKPSSINKQRVNGLVTNLVREGWQPLGKGSDWYAHRFRRSLD